MVIQQAEKKQIAKKIHQHVCTLQFEYKLIKIGMSLFKFIKQDI